MYERWTGADPGGPPHTLVEPGAVVALGKLAVDCDIVDFLGL
jgi:hypothetical protein